ncbi:MAG: Smr/MutS family protein [Thermoleophilia bacterium]|nr:Smr/MutS family protein [Thermoleophilia bacterium]
MDTRTQDLLELPAVRERLAAFASFDAGRARALAVAPSADPHDVARLRAETEEALYLAEHGVSGPSGAYDLVPFVDAAVRGQPLGVPELERVDATVRVGREVRGGVLAHEDAAPLLSARLEAIDPDALARVAAPLEDALDRRGGLRDDASPELAAARRQVAAARSDASGVARALSSRLRAHLQESFTTERGGRPVLAVKASSRGAVPGIVHGMSATGQTLFVEPYELLEAHNRVREAEAREGAEAERILGELTEFVAADEAELRYLVDALAEHDLARARGELSHAWRGCPVTEASAVDLVRARHPLLDPAAVVPVDLRLEGVRALIVSGPNTGGKTVGLKTLGLMALLHQCGLRVPAESARLPVFDDVLADIGDDQSIALNLSTFSGHVRRLVGILAAVGPRSLVLLDEVAGGTDPEEGGPLARAVIEALLGRGALVLVTTHLSALKAWAADAHGVRNASVGIDPATLRPLYTLAVGEPGASHALDIARDLGLPADVVDAARAGLAPARREADDLLRDANQARAQAQRELRLAGEERMRAERANQEAEAHRTDMAARVARQREQAQAERERAREEARAELAALTKELDGLRREIAAARKAEASRARVHTRTAGQGQAEKRREAQRDQRLGDASRAQARVSEAMAGLRMGEDRGPVEVGDVVSDPDMGFRGTVVAIEGGTAEVQGERLRLKVPVARLVADPKARAARERARSHPPRVVAAENRPAVTSVEEIDVRGVRADEARAAARQAVDDAAVTGRARVRIIHGKGTGALRAAIREELARHPLVEAWEEAPLNEGGDGATYAVLERRDAEPGGS